MSAASGDLPPALDIIWLRQPRKTREPRQPLSREQIVAAAVNLADADGLTAASTRNIAARLGVASASLYWHIQGKSDLHELMLDEVVGEIRLPSAGDGWRTALQSLARSTRAMFQRHPWAILLGIQPGLGPNTQRYGQAATSVLGDSGIEPGLQVEIIALLNNYLFGFAHRETAWQLARGDSGLDDTQWDARLRRYLSQASGQDAAMASLIGTRMRLTEDPSFEFGLGLVLDGIAALISKSAGDHPDHPATRRRLTRFSSQ